MRVEDLSFADPLKNIQFDEELLHLADHNNGGEVLRFWESPVLCVVLGRTCDPLVEVDTVRAERDGVAVVRRSSGGGTVLQGPGCLNFALVLDKSRDPLLMSIAGSYQYVLERVLGGLHALGVEGVLRPVCDLALASNDKKFSGNAQRRGRNYILHHGTLLYNFDLAKVSVYLRMPPKMPAYRQGREHDSFVTNIAIDPENVKRAIRDQFNA